MPSTLRREPFRLLFVLAALLGIAGVLPWLLFGAGALATWPGTYHAFVMTQGFLVAVVAGFLTTMIPRRTGGPPPSRAELAILGAGVAVVPIAILTVGMAGVEIAYLVVLVTLARFAIRRMVAMQTKRPPPPSFVLLPVSLIGAAMGAALVLAFTLGAPAVALAAGRSLVEEGLLVGLVMALAPMLSPIICNDHPPPDLAESIRARRMALNAGAGALFLASFAVQHLISERAGLCLRGLIVATQLAANGAFRLPAVPGTHRRLYALALLLIPAGPLAAALSPGMRVALLHLTFIGLSLLVFAVSMHVTFMHTGNEKTAHSRRWPIIAVGALTLAAALTRSNAERLASHYFETLAVASALWVGAALMWALLIIPMLARRGNGGHVDPKT